MRWEWVLLVGVILVAAVLRLGWPGWTEFKADEARLLTLALEMAGGEGVALRGIGSSVGFPNSPMSIWLYALPLLIWRHPYAATLFTGLLNTLAVALTYWFVRRYWGPRAALAAALLYAVSPWAVLYSRKIWAQNLLPLFVAGWGVGALLALVERRPRYLLLHFLCLAIAVQTHLGAVSLVAATAVLLLLFRRRVDLRMLALAALPAGLTAVPFLLYFRRAGVNPLTAAAAAGGLGDGALDATAVRLVALISTGREIHSLAGPEAFADFLATVPDMTAVHLLWGALILGGVGWLVRAARRAEAWSVGAAPPGTLAGRAAEAGLVVLVWLLVPTLFYLYQATPIFTHYFIATYPAQYVAAGVGLAALLRRLGLRRWRLGAWALLGATAAAQAAVWLALLFFVAGRPTPGGFGTPLARQLAAATTVEAALVESGAGEVLVAGAGEDPETAEFPALWQALLADVPHRFVDVGRHAVFPGGTAVVLLDPAAGGQGELYETAATESQTIPRRPGEGTWRVLTLPGGAAAPPGDALDPPPLLANFVTLLGHEPLVQTPSGEGVWQVTWRTADSPDPADYHFFNHWLDAGGERVAQADAAAFSATQWRAGDVVVSRFLLPWPEDAPEPWLMRVGMYRYPSLENVPVLDVAANPAGDAVEIQNIEKAPE